MGHSAKYEEDFYAWTREQATALRAAAETRTNLPLDWENLAEEIESMGRSDRREVVSRLGRIIEHLLKLEHSPARHPRPGWRRSVVQQRFALDQILTDSPSLKGRVAELMSEAWKPGRQAALFGLEEDGVSDDGALPPECPYSAEQALDGDWWPPNRHGLP